MIFGQGVTRSHPHLLPVLRALEAGDDAGGFARGTLAMAWHGLRNAGAAVGRALTRPRSKADLPAYYEAQLNQLAAGFAAVCDMTLVLGGALKREEMISGRMADCLSSIFLGYAQGCTGRAPPPPPPGRPAYAEPQSPGRQVPASMAFVTDSNRPQPLRQAPPTACLTASGAASDSHSHTWLPVHCNPGEGGPPSLSEHRWGV